MKGSSAVLFWICFSGALTFSNAYNKYSKDVNNKKPIKPEQDHPGEDFRPISVKHLDKPYRMAKLNLLWSKAVHRLSEDKLKYLFGELKLHDKEEITWKHLKAEGKDKDGLQEAKLREKLKIIMKDYDLLDQIHEINDHKKVQAHNAMNEVEDKRSNKNIFKDKKLNKLWEKALYAGFSQDELSALKEEFHHHQDKVDQYYSLLYDAKSNSAEPTEENSVDDTLDKYNRVETLEEREKHKEYLDRTNMIREKHRDIKDGYDHLDKLAASGPASKEFVEPKVQGLWRVALQSNFTPSELQSLKEELLHYENRLLKLRHMQAEHAINEDKYHKKQKFSGEKSNGFKMMEENIRKQARKVNKIHLDIETRIMQKHIEL